MAGLTNFGGNSSKPNSEAGNSSVKCQIVNTVFLALQAMWSLSQVSALLLE